MNTHLDRLHQTVKIDSVIYWFDVHYSLSCECDVVVVIPTVHICLSFFAYEHCFDLITNLIHVIINIDDINIANFKLKYMFFLLIYNNADCKFLNKTYKYLP